MPLLWRSRTRDHPTTATTASARPLPQERRGPSILTIGRSAFRDGPRARSRPFRLLPPVASALMTRGRRGLLGCSSGGGDPSTPTGPAGVGGLEQERGGGQARSRGLPPVLPGGLFVRTVLCVRFLVIGVVDVAGTVNRLALDLRLRLSLCCIRDRHDARHGTARLIGLADLRIDDVRLGGRDRLRGGRGCDDLAPTTRRDYWCDRSGRGLGLFKVGIVGSRGGDGICGVCRARLLSSGSLSRGGGGSGDLATTAWGRGTHGITDCLFLLVRFC